MSKIDFEMEDLKSLKKSQLKRVADYWQRQFLLKNAVKNGLGQVYCPIKERFFNPDDIQASHYIDRSKMCTRYDKDNVWLISSKSNMWDSKEKCEGYKSKHHKDFEIMLKNKIGQKNLQNLVDKSKNYCIFAKEDYIDIIQTFKNG